MRRLVAGLGVIVGVSCATPRTPPYAEHCTDPAHPCTFSYDFEPSGAARNPFLPPGSGNQFLIVNEDAIVFTWTLAPKDAWDHDHADVARSLTSVLNKVESAASGVCDGVPVFLAASNFMPGRKGRNPNRERVVAVVGNLDATPRILSNTSAAILSIGEKAGAKAPKVEGLALSADCKTLFVGLRSFFAQDGGELFREDIYPIALDIDWRGDRENVTLGERIILDAKPTCSGQDEGISSLEVLKDGTLLALTSFEKELVGKVGPEDIARGDLSGSLWRRHPDGRTERLSCFPKHKPEALAVDEDETSVRVIFEDDEYDGRPIPAFAVRVDLTKK